MFFWKPQKFYRAKIVRVRRTLAPPDKVNQRLRSVFLADRFLMLPKKTHQDPLNSGFLVGFFVSRPAGF